MPPIANISTSDSKPLYTIGITANLLGVCQATLRLWEKKSLIHPYRIGKNRFYSKCNLDRLSEIKRFLQKERVNIAGVKRIIDKSFCWEVKNCSLEERQVCPVYKRNKPK
ncbi:MAG: MerR family transcriptional regulator [Candidatus Omnitrophica bacterium]|nr:MerR family transcriptional regulator [Candidatus Omnitrophota bacterium]